MPMQSLSPEDRAFLKEVRVSGYVILAPETRHFEKAQALQVRGLLRAVTSSGRPAATFVLSGEGLGEIHRRRA